MINKLAMLFALALLVSTAACKGETQEEKENQTTTTETGLDSVSNVGSDGLGREIDTVSEIERDVNDNLDEDEVTP
jgi:hypothetical protein